MCIRDSDGIIEYLESGKTFTTDIFPVPIAYKVNYLLDNAPFADGSATEYTYYDCDDKPQELELKISGFDIIEDCEDGAFDYEGEFHYVIKVLVGGQLYKTFYSTDEIDVSDGGFLQIGRTEKISLVNRAGMCVQLDIKIWDVDSINDDIMQTRGKEHCYPWNDSVTNYKVRLYKNNRCYNDFHYTLKKI